MIEGQKKKVTVCKRHDFMQYGLKTDRCRQGGKRVIFWGCKSSEIPIENSKLEKPQVLSKFGIQVYGWDSVRKLMPLLSAKDSRCQCNRAQRLAWWWKIKQPSCDPREWTPAWSQKRTLGFSSLWKEPRLGLIRYGNFSGRSGREHSFARMTFGP